ncbi:MAG TPA: DMT family transporter [Polyangia bacterium]
MPELLLLLITVLWGTTFSLIKSALATTSPAALLVVRFAVATAAMWIVTVASRTRSWPYARALFRDGIVLGLLLAAGFVLQTEGLARTTPARSAFFTGLTVLLVPFLGAAIYRRRIAGRAAAAAILATLGLGLLTHPAARTPLVATLGGDLLSLGCALAFGLHILWTSEWSARHPLLPLTLVEIATAFVAMAGYGLTQPFRFVSTPALWATILFLGVGMTAAAFLLQNWCQRRVTPVRAALIFSLEPVVAAAFAWFHRGDRLTRLELVGGICVIAGVLLGEVGAAWAKRRSS